MKREIRCMNCVPKPMGLKLMHTEAGDPILVNPYPGEHQKVIKGRAKTMYLCDSCGIAINKGDECLASSIWADYGGIPYYPWETQCITFQKGDVDDV
jgi:hypothetical protein